MLSSVFESEEGVEILTKRFLKKLNGCIAKSFRKIRPVKKKEDSIELYDRLRSLKGKNDDKSKKEVEEIQIKIAEASDNKLREIKDAANKVNPNEPGMNAKTVWKLKKNCVTS